MALLRIDVSEERIDVFEFLVPANILPSSLILLHSEDGGDKIFRHICYYKSHTA
jgi:hypothetical protein